MKTNNTTSNILEPFMDPNAIDGLETQTQGNSMLATTAAMFAKISKVIKNTAFVASLLVPGLALADNCKDLPGPFAQSYKQKICKKLELSLADGLTPVGFSKLGHLLALNEESQIVFAESAQKPRAINIPPEVIQYALTTVALASDIHFTQTPELKALDFKAENLSDSMIQTQKVTAPQDLKKSYEFNASVAALNGSNDRLFKFSPIDILVTNISASKQFNIDKLSLKLTGGYLEGRVLEDLKIGEKTLKAFEAAVGGAFVQAAASYNGVTVSFEENFALAVQSFASDIKVASTTFGLKLVRSTADADAALILKGSRQLIERLGCSAAVGRNAENFADINCTLSVSDGLLLNGELTLTEDGLQPMFGIIYQIQK
jgi:hypothetical protein